MRLSPYGTREIVVLSLVLALLAAGAAWLHWAAALPVLAVWLAGLAFFRDPPRTVPTAPGLLVAPADGRVTEVSNVEHHAWLDGPATRIGIFLSIFDVHVNRAPCDGRVLRADHVPGEFLDARDPRSGDRNESVTLLLATEPGVPGPIVVRQVAGRIARRIVCRLAPGQAVSRGERFGMIKFGSRAEVIVPRDSQWRLRVQVGDWVRGGETVLLHYPTARPADEKHDEAHIRTRLVPAPSR